jgi:lipopolysaccharide biosynthesis glycosyltransferase
MEYSGEWKEELCTLKEAVVWHYLSRCKIWPTICKQLNKSKDKEYKLRCLIQWYFEFTKRVGLSDTFEPDALSRKDLRY